MVLALIPGLLLLPLAHAGDKPKKPIQQLSLFSFEESHGMCRFKGRLQDEMYCNSKLIERIIKMGKSAIPLLIAQLTDERQTAHPIYDYWSYTTIGDNAHFILDDLFLDATWTKFTLPGLESLHPECNDSSEQCWRDFLGKHGRKFVQDQWLAAWNANKDRIYWDTKERCYRVAEKNDTSLKH
ncbi:MAG: hypothetical protein JWO13_3539 [Acidobacteriales bacterium]|nr:hypothetical protein [Terriglobales bacterium]